MSPRILLSTAVTGGMTLISRVTGLVRDVVFAGLIGAGGGIMADAFYVAFRIPNMLRRLSGEGAFSQAFVPVFTEHKLRDSTADLQDFVNRMAGWFGLVLFVITLVGVIAAPIIIHLMAPGFSGAKYDLTVSMLRITFPYILFISLVAMAAGILNSSGKFAAAAFTPVLLNVCLIAAALLLAPRMHEPAKALAWGVFIAGVVQLLFQFPFLSRIGLLPRPSLARGHDGVSKVFRLMVPAIVGVSVHQINTVVNTILASFLVTGSVSWLYYSDRLMEFPLAVFGLALATVILPSLSRQHSSGDHQGFSRLLDWSLRWVCLIAVPATAALVVLSGPLLATFFHYGAFTERDVRMSTYALMAFSIGLPGFILIKVLAPGFYARQNTSTPMRIAVASIVINIVLSLALVGFLKHTGLALAISISALCNAAMLYHVLRREGVFSPTSGWARFLAQVTISTIAMSLFLVWGAGDLAAWLQDSIWSRIVHVTWLVAGGLVVYATVLLATGVRPGDMIHRPTAESSNG